MSATCGRIDSLLQKYKTRIQEALSIIKSLNPSLNPPYGMTDYSEPDINALEEVFPGMLVYLCDIRWLRKLGNGLEYDEQNTPLLYLRYIAFSKHFVDLNNRKKDLEASLLWEIMN